MVNPLFVWIAVAVDALLIFALLFCTLSYVRKLPSYSRIMESLAILFAARTAIHMAPTDFGWHARPVGTLIDLLTIAALVSFAVGRVENVLSVRRRLKHADRQAELGTKRQQAYNRAVEDYTGIVQHRILNPVAIINGAAITMRSEKVMSGKDVEQWNQMCDLIVEQCERLTDITLDPKAALSTEEQELSPVPDAIPE